MIFADYLLDSINSEIYSATQYILRSGVIMENNMDADNNRRFFIEANLAPLLPEADRKEAMQRATRIALDYTGFEMSALLVLESAAKMGRFVDLVTRLEDYARTNLDHLPIAARRNPAIIPKTLCFFDQCYEELGIHHGD